MSTVNYFEARRSNLAAFNAVRLNVSTITGSTIQTTATATTSSIVVSSLQTGSASYSTMSGNSLSASTLSATSLQTQSATYSTLSGSTLSASTLSASTLSASTLSASTIESNTLSVSTLTVSSINSAAPAAFSTLNVSTLNAVSSITTSTLRTTGNVGIGTTLPVSQLTVHGGNTSTSITVANGFNAANYSRYGLAYSANQYSNLSIAGDTVINAIGGNMILEAQNKNISFSVPTSNGQNTLTVSGTGAGATSSTAGWGSLTNTFKYNSIALTWTAPVACYVSSVSMYLGQGNNGTNISMYVNGNFINEWWPFQGYGLYVINSTGSSTANGVATTPTPFSAMGQYFLQAGQTLVIYVSTLQTYNYFYYGHDSTTGGIGFSVVYTSPQVSMSLSSTAPALSLGSNGVGIGASAPLATLDVNGSIRALSATYNALTSGTGVDIIYSGGGTLSSGTRGSAGALTAATMAYAASGHTWYVGSSAATNAMTVASTGRLGVGTAAPRRVVDIVGPPTNPLTYAPTQLSISDTAGSALMNLLIGVDGTSNYASIQSSQSGVGGRPLLLNASEGNVGIGTSLPPAWGQTTICGAGNSTNSSNQLVLMNSSNPNMVLMSAMGTSAAYIQSFQQGSGGVPLCLNQLGGNVGVGMTNPGYALDVAGTGRATSGLIAGNSTTAVALQLLDIPAASWRLTTGDYNLSIQNNSSSWTNRLTINQNGLVGIGTTNPTSVLTVHNAGSHQTHHLIIRGQEFYQASNSSTGIALNIGVNRSGNKQLWFMDPDLAINTTNAAIRYTLGSTTAYIGAVSTDGTASVPLNISGSSISLATGNVGIGITNPFSKLNIAGGNLQLGAAAQYENGTTCSEVIMFGGGFAANWTYGYAGIQGGCAGGGGGGGYGGVLNFWTKVNNASTYTGMTLNQGNVGIGTTDPSGTLHSYGNTVVANYKPYLFSPFTVSRSAAAASMAIVAGTETTTATLYLGTPLAPTGSGSSAYKVCILANGNGSGSGWSTADLHFCLNNSTGGSSNDFANTASITDSKMVIKTYGNVGIGTIDPSAKLHVNGATFIQGPTVGTTTTNVIGNFGLRISQLTSAQETVGQIVGQMCFHGWGRPNASSFIRCITDATNGYDDAGALAFGTSSAGTGAVEAMRISEAGNVGIGTNDTQNNKLRVFGGNSISGISIGDHLSSAGIKYIGMTNPTNGTAIGLDSGFSGMTFGPAADGATSGYVALHTHHYGINSGERMRIDKSGNVGIGKTNPGYLLDVAGSLNCTGIFVNGSAFTGGSGATWTLSGSNAYYNAGSVGIGTASPSENLTVYGSAIGLRNSSIGVFSIGLATGSAQHSSSAVAADSIIRSVNGNLMLQTGTGAAALYINSSTNYVGIGTTTPSTALTVVGSATTHGQLFSVGGNTSTYYPVLIDTRPSWATTNTYRFNISRSSVHMDATWKGATTIVVEGHNFAWGNGADYLKYKIIGSTNGTVPFRNFVANIFEDFASEFVIVYLRGGCTYYFSGHGCLLNNANTSGATLTVPAGNNASYAATDTVTAPFGSTVVSGDFRDNIWSVGGNVGIGKSNPTQLLDVNGAINCTSFLVNGTAVATGTGSVWGVNGSAAYYTSGYVGVGTANPLTTNIIGTNGGTGIDVWSTTAFDAWAKIRILCNASQYGRTSLEMIGRWENNNDGWTLNGGRNNIVFGYQTFQGSAISYVNAIQSFNGQLGFFSSGYSTSNPALMMNAIGNVGIGRVDPSQKLDVFGDGARIQVESATGNNAVIQMKTKTNTSFMFTDQNGNFQLYANTAAQHVFIQPDPTAKVAIGNNGNTPYGMLQVGHANTASGSSDGNIVFGKSTGTGYRYFKMGYDADFNFSIGDYGHAAGLVWTQQLKLAYSAPANCIVVASSGYVGIGITNPVASLHVYGGNNTTGGQITPLALTNSNAPTLRWDVGPNVNGDFCVFYSGGGVLFINRNSVNGGWIYSSDLRLKDDITVIPNCLDTIDALRPVSYRMKSNMDSQYKTFGLIAQEVKEVLPELIQSIPDVEHGETYGITYNGFIPILIGAVKELSAENATLQAANAQLTSQVASLLAWAQTQGFSG